MSAPAEESLPRAIEALLGTPPGSAPAADPDLGEWLAGLGLIRVPVADPSGFVMAGRFLARFDGGWAVMFGVPPGAIFDPLGVAAGGEPPLEAAVLAPLELPPRRAAEAPAQVGRVESIAIASEAEGDMRELGSATALAGLGLEGDRYAAGAGTFSRRGGTGRDLTLIELGTAPGSPRRTPAAISSSRASTSTRSSAGASGWVTSSAAGRAAASRARTSSA